MVIFWEKLSLPGVLYHFKLASVHYVKSVKKSWQGSEPPPPLLGNARIFTGFCTATPPLLHYLCCEKACKFSCLILKQIR